MNARTIATTLLCVSLLTADCGFAQTTALTAGGTATAGADADVPPEIKQLRDSLIEAFNRRDVDGLLAHLHPDVVVTWQNAEVSHGREGVRAYYQRMMVGPESVVVDMKASPAVEGRKIYGDTSVSYGAMNDWFKLRDGTEVNLNSRFSAHLARQPTGGWLVTGFHASSDAFEGEVHNLYAKKAGTVAALAGGAGGLLLGAVAGWVLGRRGRDRGTAPPPRETA